MAHPRQKTEVALLAFALVILLLAGAVYLVSHKGPPPVAKAKPTASMEKRAPGRAQSPIALGEPLRPSRRDPFGSPLATTQPAPRTIGAPPTILPAGPASSRPPAGEPEEQRFLLVGIGQGAAPLAVIRREGKRFMVGLGEPVEDGYRVWAIREGSVVLAKGTERLVLRLKGTEKESR